MDQIQVIAVCRTYRRIDIFETADGKQYPFNTWQEACAFVDAWWMLQYVMKIEA